MATKLVRRKTGRKLRLAVEPKLLDEICELLTSGCAVKTVCEVVGLSESSFHRWSMAGDPESADHNARFLEFWQRTTRARGRGKANLIALIRRHSKTDGKLALELLSRIAPDEYGRSNRRSESDSDGDPLPLPGQVSVYINTKPTLVQENPSGDIPPGPYKIHRLNGRIEEHSRGK